MNETMSELRERSDKAAIDELMIRAEEPPDSCCHLLWAV